MLINDWRPRSVDDLLVGISVKEGNIGKLVDGVEFSCTKTLGKAELLITIRNKYLNQEFS